MLQRLICFSVVLVAVGSAGGSELQRLPKSVPPLLGVAVVTNSGDTGKFSEWQIELSIPRIRWEVVGEMIPKKNWPELKTEVETVVLTLQMGGPSQLAESRVVDVKGKELTREQVANRLAKETPVLVSASGQVPDPYFLQLTNPDAIVIVLGPRDGSPAPELLPAKREPSKKAKNGGKPPVERGPDEHPK